MRDVVRLEKLASSRGVNNGFCGMLGAFFCRLPLRSGASGVPCTRLAPREPIKMRRSAIVVFAAFGLTAPGLTVLGLTAL